MPLLIDRLLAAKGWCFYSFGMSREKFIPEAEIERDLARLRQYLSASAVFSIDNVAKYYFDQHVHTDGCDGPEAFPNLAQPHPVAFYEYRIEPQMYDALFTDAEQGRPRGITHAGVLAITEEPSVISEAEWAERYGEDGVRQSQCRWLLLLSLFTQNAPDRDSFGVSFKTVLALAHDGSLLARPHFSTWHLNPGAADDGALMRVCRLAPLVCPAHLASSLLHCKNISTGQHHPPAKLNKAYRRRHGRPLLSYKTLTVTPMMAKNAGSSVSTGTAEPRALHLCRGHFKDYRASAGLFGRHKGLFWWDMHARGALEQGAVVKDYAIKLPNSGEACEHG